MTENLPYQTLDNPVLVDKALAALNTELLKLTWINRAFGKSEVLYNVENGRRFRKPAIYSERGEYVDLFPDEHLGSFSFFIVTDQKYERIGTNYISTEFRFDLVVWFDFRDVYPSPANPDEYTKENVKQLLLSQLQLVRLPGFQLVVTGSEDDPDAIYRDFDRSMLNNNYYRRPTGVVMIKGKAKYKAVC